jgi:hypothetical protein
MKLSKEEIAMVVEALEHYSAYLVSTECADGKYKALADCIAAEFSRPLPEQPTGEEPEKEAPWR